jgi:hypothetical protein
MVYAVAMGSVFMTLMHSKFCKNYSGMESCWGKKRLQFHRHQDDLKPTLISPK